MKSVTLAGLALVSIAASAQAQVVGTAAEGGGGFGVGYSFDPLANLVIGQAFTLNQSTQLGSVTVFVNGDGTPAPQDAFTMALTNKVGSTATSANVLFAGTGTFPNSLTGAHEPVTFATPLTLAAGTYFIVLTSAGGEGSGWGTRGAVLPSTIGTVGDGYVGFGPNGTVGSYRDIDLANSLNEDHTNFVVTAVPEPAAVALLGAGWPLLRRRRR